MKKYFENLISKKTKRLEDIRKEIENAKTVDEVRSLTKEAEEVRSELTEAKDKMAEIVAYETREDDKPTEDRSKFDPAQATNVDEIEMKSADEDETEIRGTMEYRQAFMDFVTRGVKNPILETRADAVGVSGDLGDLGAIIPLTVKPFIKEEIDRIQGTLYNKVKKTNLKGGVKYPIGEFNGAVFHRITETTVSERQKVGKIKDGIVFTYKIGEIRLARTLLQQVLTVEQFEREYAKVIAKTYVDAMDNEILNGDGTANELEGILTEAKKTSGSRIKKTQIIEVNEEQIKDWTWWEENFFAEIPLTMESSYSEFVMAKQTLQGTLKTMKDANGQPIKLVGYDANEKQHTFNSISVNRCETTLFPSFSKAKVGEYFAMLWNPEQAYCINSNMEFGVTDYFDHEKNQSVKKALVINDGKILDPNYIYLFKKAAKPMPEV